MFLLVHLPQGTKKLKPMLSESTDLQMQNLWTRLSKNIPAFLVKKCVHELKELLKPALCGFEACMRCRTLMGDVASACLV